VTGLHASDFQQLQSQQHQNHSRMQVDGTSDPIKGSFILPFSWTV
jgi:hypothetical protein